MIEHVENPAIEVHDLTVSYDKKPVLWDIDLTLPRGGLIGIVGPNGAGKSTLLKAIMGLLPLSSGYVHIFNQSIDQMRNKVSYVPQRGSVDWDFPASVFDVVLMGRYSRLGLLQRPRKADKEFAMECLRKMGIENLADRQISRLSGGQQQRVFLARALAQDADLYLMDEPFAGVDAATETSIVNLLQELIDKGKTIVVVHHDLQSVTQYFNWVILLNMRLIASGPVEQAFTEELLQETYGGKLTILSQVGELIEQQRFPQREKKS